MKHKINKKTERAAAALQGEYSELYQLLCENVKDDAYTKGETNYFIRKSISLMKEAQDKGTDISAFTRKNKKKWAVDQSKKYKKWHEVYTKSMKDCDRVSYLGLFAVVAFSILMMISTTYTDANPPVWMLVVCAAVAVCLLYLKIKHARKLPLTALYQYGDIIIFAIIGLICYCSNIFFIIYLWIYEVIYMYYLQYHVVEEDI